MDEQIARMFAFLAMGAVASLLGTLGSICTIAWVTSKYARMWDPPEVKNNAATDLYHVCPHCSGTGKRPN